jgi:hypothetical protein
MKTVFLLFSTYFLKLGAQANSRLIPMTTKTQLIHLRDRFSECSESSVEEKEGNDENTIVSGLGCEQVCGEGKCGEGKYGEAEVTKRRGDRVE